MLRDGRRATALEVQWEFMRLAQKYDRRDRPAAVGEDVGADVLARGSDAHRASSAIPTRARWPVDWVAKLRLVDGVRRTPRPRSPATPS